MLGGFLIYGIIKIIFVVSNDELCLVMMGVYFQVDFNKLILVVMDVYKLVKYIFNEIGGEVFMFFIVFKKVLNLFKGSFFENEDIDIVFNNVNVFFFFGDI